MTEQEYIEIRLYLIGPSGVGKKSILAKFESLSSSKNVILKEEELNPQTLQPKPSNSRSNSISSSTPLMFKLEQSKQQQQLKTMTKQYRILHHLLGIKAYVIPEATQVDSDYDPFKEEDEDDQINIIQKYNISFKKTKQILAHLIASDSTNEAIQSNRSLEHFMIFCFDLSNYSSFEHLIIYYQALSKQFQLKTHQFKIILGTKMEKKIPFEHSKQEVLDTFLKETSMKMYEISTKNFYPFNKFFEQFFYNHFNSYRTEFNTNTFKDIFRNILFSKPTFFQAPRNMFENKNRKDSPGPFHYNNNIYEYGAREAFDEVIMSKKKKFNTKIFINKKGPIFNKAVVSFLPDPPKETEEEKKKYKINFKSNSIQDNQCGVSFGICPGILNLKSTRQEKFRIINNKLRRSFDSNLTSLIAIKDKKVNDTHYFELMEKRKNKYIKRLIHNRSEKSFEIRKLHDENNQMFQQNQSDKNVLVKSLEILEKTHNKKKKAQSSLQSASRTLIKKNSFITPGPDAYDIRGNLKYLNMNKGFSLTGKRKIYQSQVFSPSYSNIPSDFDIILREAKRIKMNHFSERFPSTVPIKPIGNLQDINNKLEKWMLNKDQSKKAQSMKSFIEKRKIRKIDHDYVINKIKMNNKDKKHVLMKKNKGKEEEHKIIPINYELVYEKSPSYSIKGRYHHRNRSNDEEEEYNPFTSNTVKESVNYISNKLSQAIHPFPHIEAVKPALIGYSFTKEKRFRFKQKRKISR